MGIGIPFVPQRVVEYEVIPRATDKRPITPRAKLRTFIQYWLKDHFPHVPTDVVIGRVRGAKRLRLGNVHEARRGVIKAVHDAFPHLRGAALARALEVSHATVIYALNEEFRTRHQAISNARYLQRKAAA